LGLRRRIERGLAHAKDRAEAGERSAEDELAPPRHGMLLVAMGMKDGVIAAN
jgi:hypothetical protein